MVLASSSSSSSSSSFSSSYRVNKDTHRALDDVSVDLKKGSSSSWDKPFLSSTATISNAPCVSLFTRYGRFGCSTSTRFPHKGFLVHAMTLDHAMSQQSPQSWFVPPLVLIFNEEEFGYSTIESWKLKLDFLLEGILILPTNATSTSSPASSTPFNTSYTWNPYGDDLLNQDLYGIPIFYLTDAQDKLDMIQSMAIQQASLLISYNQNIQNPQDLSSLLIQPLVDWQDTSLYPAMIAQLDLYMGPTIMDSPTCLAWKDQDPTHTWSPKCLPLGGNSIWASLLDLEKEESSSSSSSSSSSKNIILVSTNMDATSMFHDVTPGANTAASNIFILLQIVQLLGKLSLSNKDNLQKQILFTAFQGENFNQLGSFSFLQDVYDFQCQVKVLDENNKSSTTPHTTTTTVFQNYQNTCLFPLRHDTSFTSLSSNKNNKIDSMIALDQLGLLETTKTFYLHDTRMDDDDNNNNNQGSSSSSTTAIQDWKYIFEYLSMYDEDGWVVKESSIQNTLPAFGPILSLHQLSSTYNNNNNNPVGGVLLTGYDSTFLQSSHYMSHADSNTSSSSSSSQPSRIDPTTLAKASTFLARAILAYATLDENSNNKDYKNVVLNAIQSISQVNTTDQHFLELSHCLFEDGYCDLFLKYAKMQQSNTLAETGVDLGLGTALGKPPNYYPSIYDASNGQAFVQISGKWYGSFNKSADNDGIYFGKDKTDTFLIRPKLLEMSIHGLFNDYLGRNSSDSSSLKSCKNSLDCLNVPYCSSGLSTCSGTQVCVCSRAHYHPALDAGLSPSPNDPPGYFVMSSSYSGNTLMVTEPFWSNSIGVNIYRDSSPIVDYWVLGAGLMVAILSVIAVYSLKQKMKKEKLY